MAYDERCYQLAEQFLHECDNAPCVQERHVDRLAQIIQDRIEDYCSDGDNFERTQWHDTRAEHRGEV